MKINAVFCDHIVFRSGDQILHQCKQHIYNEAHFAVLLPLTRQYWRFSRMYFTTHLHLSFVRFLSVEAEALSWTCTSSTTRPLLG